MKSSGCGKCGRTAENGWNFCPNCGSELRAKSILEYGMSDVFAGIAAGLAKKLLFELQPEHARSSGAFSVNVLRGGAPPRIGMQNPMHDAPKSAICMPSKPRPEHKNLVEPKVEFSKLPGKLVVELEIPGVRSLDDVDVFELGTSVEVRAYFGDTLYFKIINVPKKSTIAAKRIDGEKLVLELAG